MAINSVRTALQLLSGAGEMTRAKALEAAGTLLELPGVGETSARAGQLAEELLEAATANQAMITELVRSELDRRLVVLGLARGSDLDAAQRKIDTLEVEVAALRAATAGNPSTRAGVAEKPTNAAKKRASTTTKKTATKKTATKKTATKASVAGAKKATAKKTAAKKAPAKKTVAAKRTTRKAATKKAATKKAATKKAATKKAVARTQ